MHDPREALSDPPLEISLIPFAAYKSPSIFTWRISVCLGLCFWFAAEAVRATMSAYLSFLSSQLSEPSLALNGTDEELSRDFSKAGRYQYGPRYSVY